MHANTVKCTLCKWEIIKRYSGVRGNLSSAVDGFRYKPSVGTIQEAGLAKYLVMDGETYGSVKSFCNLGDTLDGDGGADRAATARIKSRWMDFQEMMPFLASNDPEPHARKERSSVCQSCQKQHEMRQGSYWLMLG